MHKVIAIILTFSMLNCSFGFSLIEHYCLMENKSFIETSLSPEHACNDHHFEVLASVEKGACCAKDYSDEASPCSPDHTLEESDCCATEASFFRIENGYFSAVNPEVPEMPLPISTCLLFSGWEIASNDETVPRVRNVFKLPNDVPLAFISVFKI